MYEKVLVPLDGSKLAECVLPHLEKIASGCGTQQVILVSVTERIAGHVIGYAPLESAPKLTQPSLAPGRLSTPQRVMIPETPVELGKMQKQAERYLNRIASRLEKKGLTVESMVLIGDPAPEILAAAEETGADLIIMATHGRSGISRWTHGSVADKVLRASKLPVLMVRAC